MLKILTKYFLLLLIFIFTDSEGCVKETEENATVIENARELAKLIDTRYLPTVKSWLQILTKAKGELKFFKIISHYDLYILNQNVLPLFNSS